MREYRLVGAFCALIGALCIAGIARSAVDTEWRVNLVRTGGSTVGTYTGTTQDDAYDACAHAAAQLAPRGAGYDCQTARLHVTVTADPPPPPSCSTPQPPNDTRLVACPTGFTGNWTQSRGYSAADYPECWLAGEWTPDQAPAGACTPIPQPVDCAVSAWSAWARSSGPAGEWSACTAGNQQRVEERSRTVVTQPANGGASCPALIETRIATQTCSLPPDPPAGDAIIVNAGESISAAVAKLQPGGTVIVKPGNYSAFSLKACTAAAWCRVKAETDGTVTVSGLSVGAGNWYTSIEGLKFKSSSGKSIVGAGFLKFLRVAFEGGPASGNDVSLQIGSNDSGGGVHDLLLEDVWVYGPGGRYKVLVYNSERIVLRRVVVRHDGGWTYDSRNPQGGFSLYDSRDVACQNCMFLDPVASLNGFEAGLYLVSNGTTSIRQANVTVVGGVIVDSPNNGLAAEGNGTAATYSLSDIAIAGSKQGGFNTNNAGHVLNLSRVKAKVAGYQYAKWASGGSLRVTDCAQGSGTLSSGASLTRCPGGEGPRLVNRIGTSGTLYGEPGFDAVTTEALWPFPNEARIKADFDSVRAAFGGKTLTEYVQGKIQ